MPREKPRAPSVTKLLINTTVTAELKNPKRLTSKRYRADKRKYFIQRVIKLKFAPWGGSVDHDVQRWFVNACLHVRILVFIGDLLSKH